MHFGSTDYPYSVALPHKGTDFAYIPDNIVYAPVAGVVLVRPLNGNDGNAVYIQDGGFFHGLLHLSQFTVVDGQRVTIGQKIGIMGDTGFAQGVHLHHALKLDNTFVDPENYYDKETPVQPTTPPVLIEPDTVRSLFKQFEVTGTTGIKGEPSQEQIEYYGTRGYTKLYEDVMNDLYNRLKATENDQVMSDAQDWRSYRELNKKLLS